MYLIVVAHPGEETLGCARLLLRDPERCHVIQVAGEGPLDSGKYQPSKGRPSKDGHCGEDSETSCASKLNLEMDAALDVLGLRPNQLTRLRIRNYQVLSHLHLVIQTISKIILTQHPLELHTHPFEGGNLDANAVCFAVHKALDQLRATGEVCPTLYEFPTCRIQQGVLHTAAFTNPYPSAQFTILNNQEYAAKRKALSCLQSRFRRIERFAGCAEHWRRAERYDFGERPDDRPLLYELSRSGFTWEHFAAFVASLRDGRFAS